MVTLKNKVNVQIWPDKSDLDGGADPLTDPKVVPHFNQKTRTATFTITIQTHYPKGSDPSKDSVYGQGTTDEDKKNKNTSVRFHEGQHGARVLEFLEREAPPQFNPGKTEIKDQDTLDQLEVTWKKALSDYTDALGDYHVRQTDCVGKEDILCK